MMRFRFLELEVVVLVLEAPNAMPSAAAWITSPRVVDEGRWCGWVAWGESAEVGEVEGKVSRVGVEFSALSGSEVGRLRLKEVRFMLKRRGWVGWVRCCGRMSMRYIRMKPVISEIPTQAWGSRSSSWVLVVEAEEGCVGETWPMFSSACSNPSSGPVTKPVSLSLGWPSSARATTAGNG